MQQFSLLDGHFVTLIDLFRYVKIQLDSEAVRTKTKESA